MAIPTELISAVVGAASGGGVAWLIHRQDVSRQRVEEVRDVLLKLLDLRERMTDSKVDPSLINQRRAILLAVADSLSGAAAPWLTTHVTDGERITINRSVRIYVPHGAKVWFEVAGLECDEPAGKVVLGEYTNLLYPCPANTDEQNPNILDLFANDDPGTILRIYRSPASALGRHVVTAVATVNFPGSGPTTFGNGVQGEGGYQLTYTVRRAAR